MRKYRKYIFTNFSSALYTDGWDDNAAAAELCLRRPYPFQPPPTPNVRGDSDAIWQISNQTRMRRARVEDASIPHHLTHRAAHIQTLLMVVHRKIPGREPYRICAHCAINDGLCVVCIDRKPIEERLASLRFGFGSATLKAIN